MKRVVDVLYGLKGYPNADMFAAFKTDFFANGATPGVVMDTTVATGISVTGATTTAVSLGGTATTGIAISGAKTVGISITGATGAGITIAATTGAHGFSVIGTSQTENDLCEIITATSVTSAALMKALNVVLTASASSASNMLETARFTLSSAVRMGVYANAVNGKLDLTTAGYAVGLAGAICAELDLPSTDPVGSAGTYTCFEAELGIPHAYTSGVPVSFMNMNVWGIGGANGVGKFLDVGYIFDITGVGAAAASHIFQANTDQPTHALRIRIDGVAYFMLLTSANNGTE